MRCRSRSRSLSDAVCPVATVGASTVTADSIRVAASISGLTSFCVPAYLSMGSMILVESAPLPQWQTSSPRKGCCSMATFDPNGHVRRQRCSWASELGVKRATAISQTSARPPARATRAWAILRTMEEPLCLMVALLPFRLHGRGCGPSASLRIPMHLPRPGACTP